MSLGETVFSITDMNWYFPIFHMMPFDLFVHFICVMHTISSDDEFSECRESNYSISIMWIRNLRSIEDSCNKFCYPKYESSHSWHIIDFASFKESRTEIEIRSFVFKIQSEMLVSMDMFHKDFHVFDIHLSISIKTHESFDFQLIAVFLDEIISGLIGCTTSSIDGMRKNDNERLRILFLFFLKHL